MTAVVLYTDTDAIRSCIGLDQYDVPDDVIIGQNMAMQMQEELLEVYPAYASAPASLANTLALWCMWYGALRLIESPLVAPKITTTGKDAQTRFDADWDKLKKVCQSRLRSYQIKLEEEAGTTATRVAVISASIPDYDPIIGPQ